MRTKKQLPEDEDKRLSQLIGLKRLEKPDAQFWEGFDNELKSKRLSALVQTKSSSARWGKRAIKLAKLTGPFAAIGSVAAVVLVALSPSQTAQKDPTENSSDALANTAPRPTHISEQPLFIVESMELPLKRGEHSVVPVINAPATYGLNVINSSNAPTSYTLVSMPKTFSTNEDSPSEPQTHGFGARLIRSDQEF